MDTINAIQIGDIFANRPMAIPPKATCERASPYSDRRRKTRKSPITEQLMATAIPEINARCIKPY